MCLVLGTEPEASCMLSIHSTTELSIPSVTPEIIQNTSVLPEVQITICIGTAAAAAVGGCIIRTS